jgi:YggT family protein
MLYKLISTSFSLYFILLSIDILASWVPEVNESRFVRFVRIFTQPYLQFFRSKIPPFGVLDLSPIVAFLALQALEMIIKYIIFS